MGKNRNGRTDGGIPFYRVGINTLCAGSKKNILFQVTETTCQLYVACESAHTHLHEKHGKLAKIVHEVGKEVVVDGYKWRYASAHSHLHEKHGKLAKIVH